MTIDKMVSFKTEGSTECVKANDIFFVEALDMKTRVYTTDRIFVSFNSLKEVNEILNEKIFIGPVVIILLI